MTKKRPPLPAESLTRSCNPDDFPFATTDELPDLDEVLGQTRALEAMCSGLTTQRAGYNLFALGASGIGKHSVVMRMLEQRAAPCRPISATW